MRVRRTRATGAVIAAGAFLALAVAATVVAGGGPSRPLPVELDTGGHIIGVTKESAGAVAVALTPKAFDGHRLSVEIVVNTHTVGDLDKYDLKKVVSLEVDGKSIAPTSAPGLRGHHTRGQLVFPLEALPPALAVEIRGLDEPALRVLRWP